MQPSQVKEYFPSVKRSIDNAAQLCQITRDVPDDVRDQVSELGRESDQATQLFEQEDNGNRILQCVDRLDKLGDRAWQACKQAGHIDRQVYGAVQQAHDAIATLRHRLH